MYLHLSDPTRLLELLSYLHERPDCIAQVTGAARIAVSLLGSRDVEENVRELEQRLAHWRSRNVGVLVEIADAS
jgi:hypothetical protein